MKRPYTASRDLTPVEKRVLDYIERNPGRTSEDVIRDVECIQSDILFYAIRFLVSDGWVNENTKNGALSAREEPPHSEELREP